MPAVVQAFGTAADRLSAIKVIHPHLAQNQAFVDMFLDEARIASCVQHPNVCSVLDFGESEGGDAPADDVPATEQGVDEDAAEEQEEKSEDGE